MRNGALTQTSFAARSSWGCAPPDGSPFTGAAAGPAPVKLGQSAVPNPTASVPALDHGEGAARMQRRAPVLSPPRLAASGIGEPGRKTTERQGTQVFTPPASPSSAAKAANRHHPYPVCERIIPVLANYHLSVKKITRSSGRSAVAAAAYRSAELIYCEREGRTHDYTHKSGVEYLTIITPENAPAWAQDRASLWNHAEAAETRKNAATAREWEIALPADLDAEDRQDLAFRFASDLVDRYGVVADVAIHAPHRDGDQRNHHAHILTTTRRIAEDGFTVKTRELDDRKLGSANIIDMRAHWADMQNQALERSGAVDRVDHRSLEAQREEAEHERDKLQERVTELEFVIDGYAMQLVEPGNNDRWNGMRGFEVNREWHDIEEAERERKKLEQQLQAQTLRAAKLDRAPQIKLGPAASAMERKERRRAELEGVDYQPTTERGEIVQAAQQQFSIAQDARERFDAARTAYSEARELGFSRVRSAYEAARKALLFGAEPSIEKTGAERERPEIERRPVRGIAWMDNRQRERESRQSREPFREPERASPRPTSVWDALDEIGHGQETPQEQSVSDEAMARIQERTAKQKQERETEEAERQKLDREKQEREQERGVGLGYGF